jgi:hypothetical protein
MGVATAAVTFFRQMGGTLGTAVFLSVLFSGLSSAITSAVRSASTTPEYQAALAANPEQARTLANTGGGSLSDTSFITTLDDTLAHPFQVGFSNAMSTVFLLAAGIMALGVVILWMLPELPLRTQSGLQARQAAAAPTGRAPTAPAPAAPTPVAATTSEDDATPAPEGAGVR